MENFKFHHGGISVLNLDESINWYHDILGFELEKKFHIPTIPADVAMIKRGELRMEIFQVTDPEPLPSSRTIPNQDIKTCGNKHVAFAVKNIDPLVDELKSRGADIAMVHRSNFGASAFIRDNTGNLIEFVEEPEMWSSHD